MVTAAARAKYPKTICYSPFLKYVFIPWDLMVSSYHWWLTYAEIFPAADG
jgi:hypothetical protein